MKRYQVEFHFDQGNSLTHIVKATSKESALSGIPTNGTYEFTEEDGNSIHRITINRVNYIIVNEL